MRAYLGGLRSGTIRCAIIVNDWDSKVEKMQLSLIEIKNL